MKPETLLHADLLDIIFENRNKGYGAYALALEHVTPVIAEEGTDTIPTVGELDKPVQIGNVTRDGDSIDPATVASIINSPTIGINAPVTKAAPVIYHSVQEMPEFAGCTAALQRFLLKHLRVPDAGLEAGNKITVQVQFIVDCNGTMTGIEILKSGGDIFNNEVVRVLNKMPSWKPGRQNGMAVPVYFTLPVTFQVDK